MFTFEYSFEHISHAVISPLPQPCIIDAVIATKEPAFTRRGEEGDQEQAGGRNKALHTGSFLGAASLPAKEK